MKVLQTFALLIGAMALLFASAGAAGATEFAPGDGAPQPDVTGDTDADDGETASNVVDGDNRHPSGKDRSVEAGGSGNQGNAQSDPDGDTNGGVDQPDGAGGMDLADQDGNNGCGNDDDFEDDNKGRCLGKAGAPGQQPVTPVTPVTPPAGDDETETEDDETETETETEDDETETEDDVDNNGGTAVVGATLDCGVLTVTSTKDLSNIVVVFADDSEQKFDGLKGKQLTFGLDKLDDGQIVGVFIKSGNNSDGTGSNPGDGEYVPVTDTGTDCDVVDDDDSDADDNGDNDSDADDSDDDDSDDDDSDDNDDNDDNGGNTPVSPGDGTPGPEVGGEEVLNPVIPVVSPAVPATPAIPSFGPAIPATPARPAVLTATATPETQVLGAQVTRAPGQLARTGDATTNLVPFGLGLVLLGLGVQRSSKRFAAARVS